MGEIWFTFLSSKWMLDEVKGANHGRREETDAAVAEALGDMVGRGISGCECPAVPAEMVQLCRGPKKGWNVRLPSRVERAYLAFSRRDGLTLQELGDRTLARWLNKNGYRLKAAA